ncbi:hypothetical Protein YC6258_01213 [Gynuella sunshinyii YC6258]|uniref:Uncharacterized protein n=1 Tax=Gynuella sunshinyii YC6258 TaxID=1445510 RepID=A0A0C5VGG8_9GAMM|nr:hypothetical Protein YC6258_01213 [Gynuella sunshinyii YC6258]
MAFLVLEQDLLCAIGFFPPIAVLRPIVFAGINQRLKLIISGL